MSTPLAESEFAPETSPTRLEGVKRICIEWEKMRVLYNGALIGFVIYLVDWHRPALFQTFEFWMTCGLGAVFANVCYFAGPVCEAYFHWIGLKTHVLRWAILLVGTLFAMLLTGLVFNDML